MDVMIQHIGPAWTFRILGLMALSTALPAAWLIRERTPIQSDTFIEWYPSLTYLSHSLTLPLVYRLSDSLSDSFSHSFPEFFVYTISNIPSHTL